MLATAALLASILVGPEITLPATPSATAQTYSASVAALANGDFIVVATKNITSAVRIDGSTGKPARTTAIPIANGSYPPTLRANGDRALALWRNEKGFSWIIVDKDAQPVARGSVTASFDYYSSASDVAPLADGFLVVWSETNRVAGAFIDGNGAQRGTTFVVIPEHRYQLTLASNGNEALLASLGDFGQITTSIVTPTGRVTRGGVLPLTGGNISAAWDGAGYVLAWMRQSYNSDLWLAWTDAAGHPLGMPLLYALAESPPQLVATHSGVTLFLRSSDRRNVIARLASGGAPTNDFPYLLRVDFGLSFDPTIVAAFNGHAYAVVNQNGSLLGALTDLLTPASAVPLAFTAPAQQSPRMAVGDHQAFVTSQGGDTLASVARLRDGALLPPVSIGNSGPIVADGDRAAMLMWDGGHEAAFVGEDGRVTGTLPLGNVSPGKSSYGFTGGTRLSDGTFLGIILVYGGYDDYESWYALFGRDGTSHVSPFIAYLNDTSTFGTIAIDGPAVAWADDRDRAFVARFDPIAKRLGAAIQIDDAAGPYVAVADDGAGHALVVTTGGGTYKIALIELASGKVLHRATSPYLGKAAVAWTGSDYVVVAGGLDVIEIAPDGSVATTSHIDVPYPLTSEPQMAHGAAGTFLVYTRPAVDLGLGDASRVFVRAVMKPWRHAAK